jgi:hypothetical protein
MSVSPSGSLSILARTMPRSLICSPCAPGLVFGELDRIDRDAGSEQAGAELENMLAATGVAHGQGFELDVLEVDQSTATGGLEVEAAAAQQP